MRRTFLLAVILLIPQIAAAQNSNGNGSENLPIPPWAHAVIDSFSKPVHPIVGGVASGGGLGVGIGYESSSDARWYRDADAMVTVRRYWSIDGETGIQSQGGRSRLGVFGEIRHMGRLDFFGIGPHSRRQDRSAFRLRETTVGARGWYRLVPAVRIGGSAAMYVPDLGPGRNPGVLSIERAFSEASVPGVSAEPTFGRYRGFAELIYPVIADPDAQESDAYRGAYQVAWEAARESDLGQYSFHRWETEVQQRIPGFRPGQRLTLHGMIAVTEQDADVPFYMLYTLGGSGGLKAFRPDTIGSDGTRATLRSFRNYRFRDRDLLLMQAEYRIPLMDAVHATVFVDTGQVAPRASDLFKDLRTGTGFSLSYMRKGRALVRMDVGYGGGEGVQLFWSFGAFQP
jgi:surface antigen Omp85-like protein